MPRLAFDAKMRLASSILEDCGFGNGANLERSNEGATFDFIGMPTPLLVDAGAHLGHYAVAFLEKFPQGRIVGFEPIEMHFSQLRSNFANDKRITLVKSALSDFEGETTIFRDKEVSGLASMTKRRLDHVSIRMDLEEVVSVTTLDAFCRRNDIGHINLLKLDVEGHELEALNGATGMFAEQRIDVVQFEFGGCNLDTHTNFQDFYYFMTDRGFSMYVISAARVERLGQYREIYEQYRTTNFVAVRHDA